MRNRLRPLPLRYLPLLTALILIGALPRTLAAAAQTGRVELQTGKMWTVENPPLDYLKREYGFEPSGDWLEHVRLAALRFGQLCSASFVSPDGLVMTNHHCARECIAAVSPPEVDYLAEGFYAAERKDERQCPGLFLDQLIAFEDVTDRVEAAVPPGANEAAATDAKRQAGRRIEEECERAGTQRCQVVSLYHGGLYSLYKYKRYTDVRLVFAPELAIAFFGGDPDNFTYPRHDLDVAFVRAYENGAPAAAPHYFRWSDAGAAEGELVFVIGNPGSTGRLNTLAQLERLRDDALPAQLKFLKERLAILKELSVRSDEHARRYRNDIFSLENSIKALTGYLSGLQDPSLMARKAAWERAFRDAVERDPDLRRAYGDAWERIARVQRERLRTAAKERTYLFGGSQLFALARSLVEYAMEKARPSAERLPDYRDPNLERIRDRLRAQPSVDLALEEPLLATWIANARATLPPDDPLVRALGPAAPDEVARSLVQGTRILAEEGRTAVLEADPQVLAASGDPLIRVARATALEVRKLRQRLAELLAIQSVNEERVAKALFQVYGTSIAPDATFTLRFSDGVVKGYPWNGTVAPYRTTFYGLYDRAAGHDGKEPWHLPTRWVERRTALDLATPLNFVSTNDIIGGNSGSPVINRDGEIVGLVFDGNIEQLPNVYVYSEEKGRTVSVHSAAILEALRKVYDAAALADELQP